MNFSVAFTTFYRIRCIITLAAFGGTNLYIVGVVVFFDYVFLFFTTSHIWDFE